MKQLFAVFIALIGVACAEDPSASGSPEECDGGECACDGGSCDPCDGSECACEAGSCDRCLVPDDCSFNQTCREGACVDLTPCEVGCPEGTRCEGDSQQCVQCLGNGDCASSEYCDGSEFLCRPDVCPSADSRCTDGGIETCRPTGSGWNAPVPCDPDAVCKEQQGQAWCEPRHCTPGQRICAGKRVVECAESGTDWSVVADCADASDLCVTSEGIAHCQSPDCTPGARQCEHGDVMECDSAGLGFQLVETCPTANQCDPNTLACATNQCTPNEAVCVGNSVSVCRGDGSGYASVEACGSNQVCRSGACEPIVCVPDAYTCEGNKIFSCNGTGTTRTEIADCGTKYCVPGEDTCRDQFCTPGEVRCDGALSATCNSDGTAYASTVDCRSTQQVCLGGSCTAPICEPNEVFCNSAGNVALCNIDGSGYRTRSTCLPPRNHCVDGYVDCIPRICEAGQAVCFGQLATQCNAAGDGYEPGGVDCSTQGLACSDGACVLPLCVPNEIICYLGDPHRCNPTGTDLTKQTTCAYNQFCDSVTNSCKSDLCQANSPGCLGTQLATCAADGSGYVSDGHDCASSPGMTCSGGQCVPVICTSPQQCKNDHVYECVDSGGALKLKQSCSSGTHCRDSDVTCVANVCPAGQPSCDGQRATTCNQDGSGFLSGGTSCPEKCAGGACVSSLFSDDFEDGDASDWSADAVILSVAGNAANGTSYALTAESQSLNGSATRTFAAARPRSISWWQYLDSNTGGSVEFASAYTTDPPIRLETYGNRITLASYPSNTTLAAEAWHHFEIRYVDWVKRLADVYIDGQLKYIGLGVSLSAVDRVTLRVASARRLVVDEIQFD